ncbi:MAG: hypothetical protein IKQ90_01790 [Ruminococcus sp.]|nr:hypothetical protein [Ruminococcus sp.]
MASDAVNKVLAAESESGRVLSEARRQSEDIIRGAERDAALAVQKKISEASAEGSRLKAILNSRINTYEEEHDVVCNEELDRIRQTARENTEKAADAVIAKFF